VGSHFLFQGIFLTQRLNWGLPHCWQILYHPSHDGNLTTTMELSPKISTTGLGVEEGIWQGLETKSPVCILLPLQPQKTYVYKTFVFPSPCESPSFLLKSQPQTLNVLFGLLLLMVFKVRALDILVNYSVFLGLFCVYSY